MIKNIYFFIFLFVTLFSCYSADENLSNIRQSNNTGFIIDEIQPGLNGEFYCLGYKSASSGVIIMHYDKGLNLISSTALKSIAPFDSGEQIKLRYNTENNGWYICQRKGYQSGSHIYPKWKVIVYETDENFNVLKQRVLLDRRVTAAYNQGGWIYEMLLNKAGNLVMAWDTGEIYIATNYSIAPHVKETGLRITQFDDDFNDVFAFKGDKSGFGSSNQDPNDLRIVLNQKDEIFYGFGLNIDGIMIVGKLDENGQLIYQNGKKLKERWISCNGISINKDKVIFTGVGDSENFQFYVGVNATTGDIEQQHYLPNNIYNYGERGENAMPKQMIPNAGHFVYSRSLNKVQFFSVNEHAEPTFKFNLELPDIQRIISYRQILTDHNSMIVAVSYRANNANHFTLLEMDLEGNIIR